jgi:C4-dicarboxylate-specific signal transduction histidine kinase
MDSSPWKILLVEDDEDDYILTKALLQEVKGGQFELVWAQTYEASLNHLDDRSINVLLVDYLLGTHNGLDVVKEALKRGCKAPIIVFTGQDSYEVDIEAMKIGAVDYLVKGQINAALLERTIRYAIEYTKAKDALQQAHDELEIRVQERTGDLQKIKDELEIRVAERTIELQDANKQLQVELVERQRAADERERLMSQLETERALLSTIIFNAPVAVAVSDDEGKIIHANPVAERLYRTAVKNKKKTRSLGDFQFEYLDGDQIPPEQNPVMRSAIHGETQINLEVQIKLTDGQPHYFLTNSAPILDRKNNIQGAVAILQDITQRKQAEVDLRRARDELELRVHERTQELARTNEELRTEITERKRAEETIQLNAARSEAVAEISKALVEAGHNFQAVFDVVSLRLGRAFGDACIIWFISEDEQSLEPAAFYHISTNTLQLMHEFLPSIQHPTNEGVIGRVVQTGEPFQLKEFNELILPPEIKLEFQKYCSTAGISSLIAAPIKLQGKPAGVISLLRDENSPPYSEDDLNLLKSLSARISLAMANIKLYKDLETALQKEQTMRRQLVQAEKHSAMGRMVASVAHELNNPIQTVQNCLFLTQQEVEDGSNVQEFLGMAVSEARRVSNLVTQLREIYRPTKSEPFVYLDVNKMLAEVQSLLVTHLQHENVHWHQIYKPEKIIFGGIADQIKQVFLNICLNAIEAMQPDGGDLFVDICFSENKEMAGISFRDNGPGISSENLSQLFEPFFTTKDSGTGLGLSICYDIIQRHSGEIAVESVPGKGSSFTVWLPIVNKNPSQ